MDNLEKRKRTLRKLHDLAESTPYPEEALSARNLIHKICKEYNIDDYLEKKDSKLTEKPKKKKNKKIIFRKQYIVEYVSEAFLDSIEHVFKEMESCLTGEPFEIFWKAIEHRKGFIFKRKYYTVEITFLSSSYFAVDFLKNDFLKKTGLKSVSW